MSRENEKKRNYLSNSVYGNTVREIQPIEDPRKKRKPKPTSKRVIRNRERALSMSPQFMIFLVGCTIAFLGTSVYFLSLMSGQTRYRDNISLLKEEIADLQDENDTAYNRVISSINMEKIKKKAIEEYGMVYPGKKQVVNFDREDEEFMYQYKDIKD